MTDESQELDTEAGADTTETSENPRRGFTPEDLAKGRAIRASQNPLDKLSEAERGRVELLLGELTIGPKVEGTTRRVDEEDANRLTEIATICLRRDASIAEILKDKQVTTAMIWSAAKQHNISILHEADQRALNTLHAEFEALTANGAPEKLSRKQKTRLGAYRILLRMSRRMDEFQTMFQKLDVGKHSPVGWEKKFVRGKNLQDIVPDAYKEPEKKPPETSEATTANAPQEVAHDTDESDAPNTSAVAESTVAAFPSTTSELTPGKMQLLLKLIEQQYFIAVQLARLDPHDPRVAHYGVILHDTRFMLATLGLPLSAESLRPAPSTEKNGSPKSVPLDHFVDLVRSRLQDSASQTSAPSQINLRKTGDGMAIEIPQDASGMILLYGDMQPKIIQTPGK